MKKRFLTILPVLFLFSLLFGQLVRISFAGGVLYVHDITLALCVVLIAVCGSKPHRTIPVSIRRLFFLFCFAAFVSIVIRIPEKGILASAVGFLYLLRFLYYLCGTVYIVQNLPKTNWMKLLFLTGTGFSVLGILQFLFYPDLRNLIYQGWDPHYYRLFSTLLDPNFAGIMIVLTIILGSVWISTIKNTCLSWIFQAVNILALLLTLSRSSFLAAFISVTVLIIMQKRWKWLSGLILIGICAFFLKTPGGSIFSELRQVSGMARIENWQKSIGLIASSPVIGHGFYMLTNVSEQAATRAFAFLDNSFLFVFATTGIIGFALYAALFCMLFGYSVAMRNRNPYAEVFAVSLAALFVHSQFVNSLFYPWVLLWMGILLGAAFDETMRRRGEETAGEEPRND